MPPEDRPSTYLEVLDDEYWQLRGEAVPAGGLRAAYVRAIVEGAGDVAQREAAFRHDLIARLHAARRAGLAFSGGGIRSATFGLGIMQGLAARSRDAGARPQLVGEFDFLSTVSGGGYLGAWFSAWSTRLARPSEERLREASRDAEDGPARAIRELAKNPDTGFDPEPAQVRHLRSYSNYLTPRLGMSGDTWAIAATVARNMFLNWLVLVPIFAAVLLVPVGAERMLGATFDAGIQRMFLWAGFACGALATGYIGFDLPSAGNAGRASGSYVAFGLTPLLLAAVLLNTFWAWQMIAGDAARFHAADFAWFGAAMHGGGMLAGTLAAMAYYRRPAPRTGLYATAAAMATGALAGLVGFGASRVVPPADTALYTCVAFPLLMSVFLLAGTLLVGLTSYITEDKDREWWARAGGWLLSITIGWPIFAGLVLYAGLILSTVALRVSSIVTAGITGWGAAKLGGSAQTASGRPGAASTGTGGVPLLKQILARAALPMFLVVLIVLLAWLNARVVAHAAAYVEGLDLGGRAGALLGHPAGFVVMLGCAYLAVGIGASFFINVNSFSLHAMYKQRLVRAYLGASNAHRRPHRFTGFDDHDNLPIAALTEHRPLHIVNMSLNLVGGSNLAWQQRKAESFTATRLHTGSCRVGYRPSAAYGGKYGRRAGKTGMSLGTAMTISGAAASPNMGYNSSPLLTAVMTLFNARLGWWLGNPSSTGSTWKLPGPRFGVRPFVDEMFGLTDDRNTWIYLSDGGHFENLGLYELVLRRCAVIVVSDAGADARFAYEDLGTAVRKIRVDLGIPIEFDTPMPMSPMGRRTEAFAGHHAAIGRVRYSAIDDVGADEDGVLIYLKPSLSGDEPADVRHYATQCPDFPHQATTDQQFDEAQFESYRRLGLHVVERIVGDDQTDLAGFVARAREYIAASQP
jgi:hypothetical protein